MSVVLMEDGMNTTEKKRASEVHQTDGLMHGHPIAVPTAMSKRYIRPQKRGEQRTQSIRSSPLCAGSSARNRKVIVADQPDGMSSRGTSIRVEKSPRCKTHLLGCESSHRHSLDNHNGRPNLGHWCKSKAFEGVRLQGAGNADADTYVEVCRVNLTCHAEGTGDDKPVETLCGSSSAGHLARIITRRWDYSDMVTEAV